MSSNDIEMHLIAYDEASSVIEGVGSNISTTFTDIEENTQELASSTSSATSQVAGDYEQVGNAVESASGSINAANMSSTQSAMAMSTAAMSGAALFMSFTNVENAEVSLDKAHLQVQKSTQAVQNAQEAYNTAVEKYGPDSQQATDAANKLSIAQDALTVAQERVGTSQRNLTNSMLMAALTVIPSLVSVISLVSNASKYWTSIQEGLNAAFDANPIGMVCLAIAALVAIIIIAWNACPPFRDAVKEIATVLGGALTTAIQAIDAALTWFWNNVLVPIGTFIVTIFVSDLNTMGVIFQTLGAVWNTVCGAIKTAWDFLVNGIMSIWKSTGAPVFQLITDFINGIKAAFQFLFGWLIGGSLWPDLCGGLGAIWNNVVGPLLGVIQGFVNGVVGFFQGMASTLSGIWNGIVNGISSAASTISSTISSIGTTVSNGVAAVGNALGSAANAVGGAMGTVANSVGGALSTAGGAIAGFIGSICFAHALANAAESSKKTMDSWVGMVEDSMDKGKAAIKDFNVSTAITGTPSLGTIGGGGALLTGLSKPTVVNIETKAPLINIEGSADKATVNLATKQLLQQLKSMIVEPTSTSAPATSKRIRQGSVFT